MESRAFDDRWADAEYAELEQVLRERSGLVFSALRRTSLEGAAARVIRRIGIASHESLVSLIRSDGAVFDELMAEVTVGERIFFASRRISSSCVREFCRSFDVADQARSRFECGARLAPPARSRTRLRLCCTRRTFRESSLPLTSRARVSRPRVAVNIANGRFAAFPAISWRGISHALATASSC